ncbi:MAG: phosphotransferase [Sulfurimonas sp.]|nr:phosphotransferase [Sulfurimonas sp.]
MGAKSKIALFQLQNLFPSYSFVKIRATSSGIIDTTYIVYTKDDSYILKKYERDISKKIAFDTKLLKTLKASSLNVPLMLEKNDGWYIYERLKGKEPKNVQTYHLRAVARFLSQMHLLSSKSRCKLKSSLESDIKEALCFTKKNYFSYYKKFEFLKDFRVKNEGIIHGDLFKDNTVFDGTKLGVFDFIDAMCGSFVFDLAIALVGFDVKADNDYAINIFLNSYNQRATRKIDKKTLKKQIKYASHFYALKRVYEYKNTNKARELL